MGSLPCMRAVIQRVSSASVTIAEQKGASIAFGLLVLMGIEETDGGEDVEWLLVLTRNDGHLGEAGRMGF